MSLLRLNILGRFEALLASGEILSLPTHKAEVLLTYLAMTPGQPQSRERLAGLLWSARGDEQARNSLRQTLSAIRKSLAGVEPQLLTIDRMAVSVVAGTIDVDALELECLNKEINPTSTTQTVALYQGEFLEGVVVRDPIGEEWLAGERDRYRQLAILALASLVPRQMDSGEVAKAVETAERLATLDLFNESVWQQLMKSYALRGERNKALLAYNRCIKTLKQELGVEPEQETTELRSAIRVGTFNVTPINTPPEIPNLANQTPELPEGTPSPTLPEKPSIAVLPFTSMSSDAEQDYLADGITNDIINNLSRFRDLFVIASYSSFVYKGKAMNVQTVSRELGARYILEGSVQQSKDVVRINVQLIDGSTGSHLWAERYQRQVDDVFALQDEVVELIVGSLATSYGGHLHKAWQRNGPQNPRAFDAFILGLDFMDNFTPQDNRRSKDCFEEDIRLNPNYGKAYAKLAWVYLLDAIECWGDNYEELVAKGRAAASKGVEVEDEESWVHWSLAACHFYAFQHDQGIAEFDRTIELNPNDADVLSDAGYYFAYAGKAEQGAELIYQAIRINPHYPEYYLVQLGQVLFDARKYEEALTIFASVRKIDTPILCLYLSASHAAFSNTEMAKLAVDRLLQHDPRATIAKWTQPKLAPYKNRVDTLHLRENLRNAGLAE
ncbi:MAG: adenylate cyclase [Parasphingorhabdus sp.]|jgi:adenylate cyclase